MENVDKAAAKKEVSVAAPDHTEQIKSQVLAKIGKPPRLDHVEVSQHHGRKYRVNIWQQPESDNQTVLMIAPRVGLSYYLTVSESGEILDSNPPLSKAGFVA
ncbi:MAG: hypothetical protein ACLQNE_12855 [Thermoguttaceae bacterium]